MVYNHWWKTKIWHDKIFVFYFSGFQTILQDSINLCVTFKQLLRVAVIWLRGVKGHTPTTVPFQPDTHGHQSAAVKGKNKHFYCAAFIRLLSLASWSLKINIMAPCWARLIGQHLLVGSGLTLNRSSTKWNFIAAGTWVICGVCVVVICVELDLWSATAICDSQAFDLAEINRLCVWPRSR